MHDGVNPMIGKDSVDLLTNGEISLAKNCAAGDGGAMSFLEIIESNDVVAASDENFSANTANVAGGTGDEDVQRESLRARRKHLRGFPSYQDAMGLSAMK
jgi:hypothetical protein